MIAGLDAQCKKSSLITIPCGPGGPIGPVGPGGPIGPVGPGGPGDASALF